MSTILSNMGLNADLDLQMVGRVLGSDVMLFVTAVLGYLALHHFKSMQSAKAMHNVKVKAATATMACMEPVPSQTSSTKVACPKSAVADSSTDVPGQSDVQVLSPICAIDESKASNVQPQPVSPIQVPSQERKNEYQVRSEKLPLAQQRSPQLVVVEPFDLSKQVALMNKYAAARNIKDTLRTFRLIEQNGATLDSAMYNTVMRAWIKCGNVWAAENWMDEMKEVGAMNENSFIILMKALMNVRDLEKGWAILANMEEVGVTPTVAVFDELLCGFARGGLLNDGIYTLSEMDKVGVKPSSFTLETIALLMSSARHFGSYSLHSVQQVLEKYGLEDKSIACPLLASVIAKAKDAGPSSYVHNVEIKGSQSRIRAVRKTLKQIGFLDKDQTRSCPLDGHWQTEHGLTVIIEGKIVRWSRQRASRLCFAAEDKRSCTLMVYGEPTNGHLTEPIAHDATRAIRWSNGDVWHSYDGRFIGEDTVYSQSMSKCLRDKVQDVAYQARSNAVLKCVSKHGLNMPSVLQDSLADYLGNNLYYVRVQFESEMPRTSMLVDLSQRHPRVGFRHCWAKLKAGSCGQRTIVNGSDTDEACFNRHIEAVQRA